MDLIIDKRLKGMVFSLIDILCHFVEKKWQFVERAYLKINTIFTLDAIKGILNETNK